MDSKQKALIACEAARLRFAADCERKKLPNELPFIDEQLQNDLTAVDAHVDGSFIVEFKAEKKYCNHTGMLQGGAYGLVFDSTSCWNVLMFARPGSWDLGLFASRSMHISYLRPVPQDTVVRVHSRVMSIGKTMVLLHMKMESEDGRKLYATAQHDMVGVQVTGEQAERMGERLKKSLEQAERNLRGKAKI